MIQQVSHLTPVQRFFESLCFNLKLIKQDRHIAYVHFSDEFFMQVELVDEIPKVASGVLHHAVWIRSVWVPPHARNVGSFHENMTMVIEWAELAGVALFAIANPFELTSDYSSIEDMKRVFVDGVGFRVLPDYKDKQLRQRQRFKRLGFTNMAFGHIGNRDRIRRKDCFVYLPKSLDEQVKLEILRNRR